MVVTSRPVDPYRAFNFKVELGGITQGGFQEVSGLDTSTPAIEYREGIDPNHTRKLTGLNAYSAITLSRGIVDSKLWDWRQTVIEGVPLRINGSIVLWNDKQEEVMRWNFMQGWPSRWTGPALNAGTAAIAVEVLEITIEELTCLYTPITA